MLISSQDYLDDRIVADKRDAEDYAVLLSPEFELDGQTYQVVLDGHHSLAAAKLDGVDPDFEVATVQQHDAIGLLPDAEAFLAAVQDGIEFVNVETGESAF